MENMEVFKKYYFTEQEFLLLAGSLGLREIYGFLPKAEQCAQEWEECRLLYDMTKKKFLRATEDGYKVTEEIRKIFQTIKEAEIVLTIKSVEHKFAEKCIYLSELVAEIEVGDLNGNCLKGSVGTAKILIENLAEELAMEQAVDALELYPEGTLNIKEEGNQPRTIIEKWNIKDERMIQTVLLSEGTLYDVIEVKTGEEIQVFYYSMLKLKEVLAGMMGEEMI